MTTPDKPLDGMSRPFLIAAIALAVVGFLIGTAPSTYDLDGAPEPSSHVTATDGEHEAARSYTELREMPRGPGSGWTEGVLTMRADEPGILDEVFLAGTDLDADLDDRMTLRAFDGAPPTVPHPINASTASECLVCHEDGARFNERIARPMSHVELPSCTQCHVLRDSDVPGAAGIADDPRDVPNRFVGLLSPDRGPRSNAIAPPQLPHTDFMRERCESCHGINGREAIRSTHPWRLSCPQCHTTFADIERRPGVAIR